MLAGAGLGDNALFAHAPRHHDLAEHVVDLVRAGMVELLALEIDFRAAEMPGEALGEIQRRRPADIVPEIAVHFRLECRIGLGIGVSLFQIEDQRHQRFRDKAPAENAEMAAFVGTAAEGIWFSETHRCLSSWPGSSRPSTSYLLSVSTAADPPAKPPPPPLTQTRSGPC